MSIFLIVLAIILAILIASYFCCKCSCDDLTPTPTSSSFYHYSPLIRERIAEERRKACEVWRAGGSWDQHYSTIPFQNQQLGEELNSISNIIMDLYRENKQLTKQINEMQTQLSKLQKLDILIKHLGLEFVPENRQLNPAHFRKLKGNK